MRISGNTAMTIACRLASQKNDPARSYDIAYYVNLHKCCGRSVAVSTVGYEAPKGQPATVLDSVKARRCMLMNVYCENSKNERHK